MSVVYAECNYAECGYTECGYAKCGHAEFGYAECLCLESWHHKGRFLTEIT